MPEGWTYSGTVPEKDWNEFRNWVDNTAQDNLSASAGAKKGNGYHVSVSFVEASNQQITTLTNYGLRRPKR
jgi:hypothetical protein